MPVVLDSKVPSGPLETKWEHYRAESKLVSPNNKRKFDILVVGSGLAGASAAATLADLVVVDGHAKGIVVRDLVGGQISSHAGDTVVLATGGYSMVF